MTPDWKPSRYGDAWTLTLREGYLEVEVVREIQSRDNPSDTPYAVILFGKRLTKTRWATAEEAKTIAVGLAQRVLGVASANLAAFVTSQSET